jgi:2-haloacid dehalogenase
LSKYKCLIFDVDNTILQYDASAAKALEDLLLNHNVEYTPKIEELFRTVCYDLWKSYNMNLLDDPVMQEKYHEVYKIYGYKRFEVFLDKLNIGSLRKEHASDIADEYNEIFNNTHIFENHAIDVLKHCSKTHIVAAATNGIKEIQQSRLSPVKEYLSHLFISEEMGCVKPMKQFYNHMLETLNLSGNQCLFIGDLYTTDILGAINVQMDALWYINKERQSETAEWLESSNQYEITVPVIHSLLEIYRYI